MLLGSSGPACGPRHIYTRSKIVAHFWVGTGDSMGSLMNLNSRKPSVHAAASPHVCLCLAAARFSTTRPRTATFSLLTPFSPQTWLLPNPPYFRLLDVHFFFLPVALPGTFEFIQTATSLQKNREGYRKKGKSWKDSWKQSKLYFHADLLHALLWPHDGLITASTRRRNSLYIGVTAQTCVISLSELLLTVYVLPLCACCGNGSRNINVINITWARLPSPVWYV